jgi:hypothetical protein
VSHGRILLLGFVAFTLAGCAKDSEAGGSSVVSSSFVSGFLDAWRQFLEIDNAAPASAPLAHARTTASGSNARLGAEISEVTEQIRRLFGDSGTYLEGFPQAEEGYRSIPTRFRDQVVKIQENKANADPDTVRRRLTQLSTQVTEVLERQHTRFNTLRDTFSQRMDAVTKRLPELEQKCAKVQAEAAASDEARSCSGFLDADAMIKTRAEPIAAGFTHLEDTFKEVRQDLQQLAAQTMAAANGK